MAKNNRPQKLVMFYHTERSLFYIGSYDNGPRFNESSSIEKNYARAKFIYDRFVNGRDEGTGLQSGFMMALINTDYQGWQRQVLLGDYEGSEASANAKIGYVEKFENMAGWTNVGSHARHVKGLHGTGAMPAQWTRKWNIGAMKIDKIRDKIEFIVRSMADTIPDTIYKDAYMATVCPETHGPRYRNYGSYQVESLQTLFRFVRNYLGKDL